MLISPRKLRELGIVGMNQRNGEYIMPCNPRRLFPLVDDKLATKRLAEAAGIAVPQLYGVIRTERQVRELGAMLKGREDFVIKPAHGSGGAGIVVVTDRRPGGFRRSNGRIVTREALEHHVSNILSGMHSLGGAPDQALIEQRVRFAPVFEKLTYGGVPDIRSIVFRGVPVMAMVRLPTQQSDGKANLHQGAVGAGIALASGRTLSGVWRERLVHHHPDTGMEIAGLAIPGWDRLMVLAARCQELVGLDYLGVDVVLDAERGPLVLELNARPGLSIQLANRKGLAHRLDRIKALAAIPDQAEERAALAMRLFADGAEECETTAVWRGWWRRSA
ncbi:alpha-L-glutamate ligase-like protein [Alkalilimnicola sp. S0819]|uniref:alpha-L-glutamate ligase-like protein n=1 Tax=Alkalilimnicola sp. S0819 TaxID=2613922 RepID=UPI00126199DE|nr:alpha-L-glutamate ligase-like protein [Alkalilimnicola sp. S0819]KAB7622806.1 alpha-L-glutamate ligase-like protein [Alkalilimnicola sp. S0819]MPQ17303.1 alpha-L-glutamate ligase-like protein [Alkalilimnicola sp. S0819]